jgi:hypothetical protein
MTAPLMVELQTQLMEEGQILNLELMLVLPTAAAAKQAWTFLLTPGQIRAL